MMATEIDRFVVGCTRDDPAEFQTRAEQWEDGGRVLITLEQIDPHTNDLAMILLDKADILRLADQLRGH